MKVVNTDWFQEWFDSPYYSILYKDRNFSEAEKFLKNFILFLKPLPHSKMLDVACGQGRHSVYLNKNGFDVTGIDISKKNIEYNKKYENKKLSFVIHDMRECFQENYYDYAFNLFTSFGYFENENENINTIKAISNSLNHHGKLIFDFMNIEKIITELIKQETKIIDGIAFNITRSIINDFIIKEISFSDQGKDYSYKEKVKALRLNDFEKYFALAELKIVNLFGDYDLNPFDEKNSDRLILVAEKIH